MSSARASTDLVTKAPVFDRGDVLYAAYLLLPLSAFFAFGRALGWLEMLVRPRSAAAVRANLTDAFGDVKSPREIQRLARKVFEYHQTRVLLAQVAPLLAARGKLERLFPIQGLERLEEALRLNKGAILLGSHVNSIALFLAAIQLRRRGFDVRCPMPESEDAWAPTPFRRLINRLYGAPSLSQAIGAFYAQFNARPLVRLLSEGTTLVFVGDGWHSASFADVEFLGRKLPFTNGPLGIARAAGCPVIPAFSVGAPDRIHFELEPAFFVDRSGSATDDVSAAVTRFINRVEQRMLADIPCWQHWFERDLFRNLEQWRSKTLQERYTIAGH